MTERQKSGDDISRNSGDADPKGVTEDVGFDGQVFQQQLGVRVLVRSHDPLKEVDNVQKDHHQHPPGMGGFLDNVAAFKQQFPDKVLLLMNSDLAVHQLPVAFVVIHFPRIKRGFDPEISCCSLYAVSQRLLYQLVGTEAIKQQAQHRVPGSSRQYIGGIDEYILAMMRSVDIQYHNQQGIDTYGAGTGAVYAHQGENKTEYEYEETRHHPGAGSQSHEQGDQEND